jgi:hypothetical protein
MASAANTEAMIEVMNTAKTSEAKALETLVELLQAISKRLEMLDGMDTRLKRLEEQLDLT